MSVAEERTRYIMGHIARWPDGRWHFPTLCVCLVCEGHTSIVRRYPEESRFEPEEATRIALVQHGYYLAKWEDSNTLNAFIVPRPCTCGHLHDWKPVPSVDGRQLIGCSICTHVQGKPDSSD